MAIVTLTGTVDTLASGRSWLVEIDFNEQQPNLISEEDDTAFTTSVGNWYFQVDALWDNSGALLINGNGTPGNYMELRTDSVSRLVLPMEKGKRYKYSMRIKSSSEPIDVRMGLKDLWHYDKGFSVLGDGEWVTLEHEFLYNDPTAFRDLRVYFDTFWDQNNEVYVDWVRMECLDVVPISDSSFAVVEFGEWSVGNEDLKPAFIDGFKTSLVIRPLGGGMTENFRSTLSDWLYTFSNNVGRVRFYDNVEVESPELVWRGKIDQSSVSIDLVENTISFDIVDFVIGNADVECNTNPFGWSIVSVGNLLDRYRTLVDLFKAYANYMSPWIMADIFYSSVVSDDTLRGWDISNRFANITGWPDPNQGNALVRFGIFADRYFSDAYTSPYASTLGELLNDIAFALGVKITPWLYGQILVSAVYPVEADVVAISDSVITEIEQGIRDFDVRGAKVTTFGTMTTASPTPYTNFERSNYVPSETACVDGAGNLRKGVESYNLMFLNDRVNTGDANTLVADLVSQSNVGGVITQSYFVNNVSYTKPTRFSIVYQDNGVETSTPWLTFEELHRFILQLGFIKRKKFIKVSLTGTVFDPTKYYSFSWDDGLYRIQSQTIDWVNNQTELYLIEV